MLNSSTMTMPKDEDIYTDKKQERSKSSKSPRYKPIKFRKIKNKYQYANNNMLRSNNLYDVKQPKVSTRRNKSRHISEGSSNRDIHDTTSIPINTSYNQGIINDS